MEIIQARDADGVVSWECEECGHDITTTEAQSVEHDTSCSLHPDNEV